MDSIHYIILIVNSIDFFSHSICFYYFFFLGKLSNKKLFLKCMDGNDFQVIIYFFFFIFLFYTNILMLMYSYYMFCCFFFMVLDYNYVIYRMLSNHTALFGVTDRLIFIEIQFSTQFLCRFKIFKFTTIYSSSSLYFKFTHIIYEHSVYTDY